MHHSRPPCQPYPSLVQLVARQKRMFLSNRPRTIDGSVITPDVLADAHILVNARVRGLAGHIAVPEGARGNPVLIRPGRRMDQVPPTAGVRGEVGIVCAASDLHSGQGFHVRPLARGVVVIREPVGSMRSLLVHVIRRLRRWVAHHRSAARARQLARVTALVPVAWSIPRRRRIGKSPCRWAAVLVPRPGTNCLLTSTRG